jgi:methylated-DNA-[protein]-cysteine S-methyltransferase
MNLSTTVPTPAGPLTIVASDQGAVRAAGFTTDLDPLLDLLPRPWRRPPEARPDLGDISKAVAAYLAGDHSALDQLRVEPRPGAASQAGVPVAGATPAGVPGAGGFLEQVWQALRRIPPGRTLSYTELAAAAGRPAAVRAAAYACARNPIALIVPCHRVLRTDGGLGGYRWGARVKSWLLTHEGVRAR